MATIVKKTVIAFLKIGMYEHNKALQNGMLRFGSLNSYSKTEDKSRVDKLETVIHIEELPEENILTLFHPSMGEINVKVDSANIWKSNDQIGHAFCLFAIQPIMIQNDSWQLNSQMIEKGDSILLINNPKEFIRRTEVAIKNQNFKVAYDFISYKSFERYTGKKSVFEKDLLFKEEQEFRFYVDFFSTNEAEYLEVGDLSDISIIIECNNKVGGPRFLLKTNQKL